jgi:hypothetical protein
MAKICSSAKSANIAVVLGFSENDHNSLYISQCTISPAGEIVMKRRKFKPTHMERTVFGDAGGSSLNNVADIDGVGHVGALSCWEHIQPLLKYHTTSLREQIHVAAWPPIHPFEEGSEGLFSMSAEGVLFDQSLSRDIISRLADIQQAVQLSLKSTRWSRQPSYYIALPSCHLQAFPRTDPKAILLRE